VSLSGNPLGERDVARGCYRWRDDERQDRRPSVLTPEHRPVRTHERKDRNDMKNDETAEEIRPRSRDAHDRPDDGQNYEEVKGQGELGS
jgi:hypothetical protein